MSAVPIASPIRPPKVLFRLILLIHIKTRAREADPVEKHDPAKDIRRRRSGKLDKRMTSKRRNREADIQVGLGIASRVDPQKTLGNPVQTP